MDSATAFAQTIVLLTVPVTLLASLIKQEGWPKWVNQVVAFLVAVVGGAVDVALSGGFTGIGSSHDPGTYVAVVVALYGASQAVYAGFRNSDLEKALTAFPATLKRPSKNILVTSKVASYGTSGLAPQAHRLPLGETTSKTPPQA